MNKKKILILCACAAAVIVVLLLVFKPFAAKTAETSASPSPAAVSAGTTSPATASPSASAETAQAGTALSADQLQSFASMLNEAGNYGFLLSQYSDVRAANLTQVFYLGAGITPAPDAQSIVDAYQAALGSDAPQTDCTVLKTAQINALLQEKTGYTLKQMKSDFDWEYDQEHDAYLFFHSDTNQRNIKVASGKSLGGDKYELTCTFDGTFYDPEAGAVEGSIVTFRSQNGKPVFISNTFVT